MLADARRTERRHWLKRNPQIDNIQIYVKMTHFLRRRGSGGVRHDSDDDDARRVRRDVIMFSIELAFFSRKNRFFSIESLKTDE